MTRLHMFASLVAVSCTLAACGGSSGNGGQTPPPSGGGTAVNPCSTAAADEAELGPVGTVAGGQSTAVTNKKILIDGNPRGRALEGLWLHDAAEKQRQERSRGIRSEAEGAPQTTAITTPAPVAQDIGEIAVLQDQGDLIAPANHFDIASTGLRFTRNGGNGYSISRIDAGFRSALGTRLTLTDDDSAQQDLQFSFPFYGGSQQTAFVNSDGNITFGEADHASTERSVSRLLTGPPRISLFLSDLDPSTGTGRIFVNAASDQYTVTWCTVRAFDSTQTVTAQATLLPDGSIEFKYEAVSVTDAVIGLSPGRTGSFSTINLNGPNPSSGTGALGESFAAQSSLDTVAIGKKFFESHPDNYDQILIWTDQRLIRDAFAFEITVANEIRGIAVDLYDLSHDYGSGGRLRSVVVMDFVGKFPDDPNAKFLGENSTVSVMGQEVGHRWLAYMNFRDHNGVSSDALLGRDLAHWSFFFNSDASVMEGNKIDDLGGGQFRTTDAVRRYSRLDQYAMGLVPPTQVPSFFYVENPNSTHAREDAPQIGVTFSGTRRDVLVDDVIAIQGERSPSASDSPKVHRQAFILLVSSGRSADAAQVAKVDNIRRAWEPFFHEATENRMTVITTLK
jgi:hypothetical protein